MLRAANKLHLSTLAESQGIVAQQPSVGSKKLIHTSRSRLREYDYNAEQKSGSAGGKIIKFVGLGTVAVAAPLGYAMYDPEFRKTLQHQLPFTKPILDGLLKATSPSHTPARTSGPPQAITKPSPTIDTSKPISFTPSKPVVSDKKPLEVKPTSTPEARTPSPVPTIFGSTADKVTTDKTPLASEKKPVLPSELDGNKAGSDKKKSSGSSSGSGFGTGLGTALAPAPAPVNQTSSTTTSDLFSRGDDKELRQDVVAAKAKIAGLETKVQTLEKAAQEVLEKAKRMQLYDLAVFLDGRELTPDEEKLVEAAVASAKDHLDAAFDTYIEELEEEHEWDVQQQLKRQIAAHAGAVGDALKQQEQELEKLFQTRLERRLEEERQRFNLQVASALGRVKGIEDAIASRAKADKLSQKAQYLWHTSHALYDAVKHGEKGTQTTGEKLVPLSRFVTLAKVFSDSHPFVLSILRAVPEEALVRGVYSEDTLRARFENVRNAARRVALVDDHNASMFRYFLSYIQSVLVRDRHYALNDVSQVDLDGLDTFRILATAHRLVQEGDLETAVRFVGQLQGEPRRVAQDWLKETRLYLETQQISRLLLAHASSVGLANVPVEVSKNK
ncbi:hypothetical protein RvY_00809 [Ramazzottius varieornatus]|uniref:MICOS complex subunit MIC60 n=1 Tax=Ramazzottius varieornatus TaxID=947166 RepID=A0A1D1UPF3_RAMVA|nr:hypothetical protein RvY_00809 [Ramazzottius varieornatus]